MEPLKHECGVAMIRLLKPLEYYQEKYGTWMYGLNKLYLLMENSITVVRKPRVWRVSSFRQIPEKNICFEREDWEPEL